MPVAFDLTAIIAEAARVRGFAGDLGKVKQRTIGTLARRLPVIARRDIQQEYNLPASRINEGLVTRATGGMVELTGKKRGIGFVAYGARDTRRKGVVVTIVRGKREQWSDAFIARGRGGNLQAFVRQTKKRLPIQSLYGTSIATALRKPERQQRIRDAVADVLRAEIDRLTQANR